jgi:hypothetical protein
MSFPRHARALRLVLTAAAVALSPLALHTGTALANDFHVFSCQDPYNGQGAPTDDWRYDQGTNGYGDGAGSSCSGGGGAISAWLAGGVNHGFGEGGYATFSSPAGMTISSFGLWRYEAVGPYEPYAAPVTNIAYDPGNVSLEGLCAQSLSCATRGNNGQRLAPENYVGAGGLTNVTQIQTSAVCGGGPGTPYVCPTSNAENGNSAEVDVYAADIVLIDTSVPSISNVSGPLIAGGTLSGTQPVSFNASDSGPGIYSGSIIVDGRTITQGILDTNGGACESLNVTGDGLRSFNHPQPCKPALTATMVLNTTQLSAGTHNVQVTVDDASGNATTAWNGTITTNNPPTETGAPALHDTSRASGAPEPGDVLQISPGTWSPAGTTFSYAWESCAGDGSDCHGLPGQSGAQYTVQSGDGGRVLIGLVTATSTSGSRQVQAGVTPDIASSSGSSASGGGITGAQPGSDLSGPVVVNVDVGSGTPVAHIANGTPCAGPQLALKVNGRSNPAPIRYGHGATINGLLRCGSVPVREAKVLVSGGLSGIVQTNAQGAFIFSVPPGPGRTLAFSYTAYSDDTTPAATARAVIAVYPVITLAIGPRHTHNDATITWRGKIAAGPYPPGGVTLLIQVREGRRWQTFDQITTSTGRFAYRYTFRRTTQPTTYTFRVALPASGSGGYPYAPAGSNTIRVHVV